MPLTRAFNEFINKLIAKTNKYEKIETVKLHVLLVYI